MQVVEYKFHRYLNGRKPFASRCSTELLVHEPVVSTMRWSSPEKYSQHCTVIAVIHLCCLCSITVIVHLIVFLCRTAINNIRSGQIGVTEGRWASYIPIALIRSPHDDCSPVTVTEEGQMSSRRLTVCSCSPLFDSHHGAFNGYR